MDKENTNQRRKNEVNGISGRVGKIHISIERTGPQDNYGPVYTWKGPQVDSQGTSLFTPGYIMHVHVVQLVIVFRFH